jgi:8-oxo-dGTP diphosphatase
VAILLLRHASAGSRKRWKGDDRLRPLDRRGRRQAQALPGLLGAYAVTRVLSSPFERCVQTVQPLAAQLGLEIETRDELQEGAGSIDVHALLEALGDATAVVCSHGDVIFDLVGWDRKAKKASTWVLERDGDRFAPALYLPPPA